MYGTSSRIHHSKASAPKSISSHHICIPSWWINVVDPGWMLHCAHGIRTLTSLNNLPASDCLVIPQPKTGGSMISISRWITRGKKLVSKSLDQVWGSPHTKWRRSLWQLKALMISFQFYTLKSLGASLDEALISCDCSMSVHAAETRRFTNGSERSKMRWRSFTRRNDKIILDPIGRGRWILPNHGPTWSSL